MTETQELIIVITAGATLFVLALFPSYRTWLRRRALRRRAASAHR